MEVQSIQSNRSGYSVSSVGEGGDESLIFERNVEEPFIPVATDCRACGLCSTAGSRSSSVVNIVSYASPQQVQQQPCKHSVHHNLENLIAPALDASANIVEDEDTNLNNVEMICSKRPSTIGLNMALGRTRTNSLTGFVNDSDAQSPVSVHSTSAGANSERNKVLSFYSYVDMLSNESPYQANFTNPFILSAGTNRRNSGSSGMLPPFRRLSHVQNVRTSNSSKSTRVGDFSIGPPGND